MIVYILERRVLINDEKTMCIDTCKVFSSIDHLHQWIRKNNQKYEKKDEYQWFFFAYNDKIDTNLDDSEKEFLFFDWDGLRIKI